MESQKKLVVRKKKSVGVNQIPETLNGVPTANGSSPLESSSSPLVHSGVRAPSISTMNKKGLPRKPARKRKNTSGPCDYPPDEPVSNVGTSLKNLQLTVKGANKPLDTLLRPSGATADWDEFLRVGYNLHFIPPVTFFKNGPLVNIWNDLAIVGRVVEIPNPFIRCPRPVNWIAIIRHFAGYKALVEFEGFGITEKFAAWMSFCSDIPKPLGYSDKKHILLHPPHEIRTNHPDFLEKARSWIKDRDTVAENHGDIIRNELKRTQRFPLLTMLEVMDRDCANRMRVAIVTGVIGNRVHVTYVIEPRQGDIGYWFDVNSDYVHPIGWSQTVGHEIYGVPSSAPFTPLPSEYFPAYPKEMLLFPGQMLEARHPLRPYLICAASIVLVLKHGYFVAEFRTNQDQDVAINFTFHVTSPFVFPCGFCEQNDIKLVPPYGEGLGKPFNWKKYLDKHRAYAAPLKLIPARNSHKFRPGMKMEACGILDPTYMGPATIKLVRAHLIYLCFDGWPSCKEMAGDTQFWSHAESTEIYPIGYAEMVGHNFQGRVLENTFSDVGEQFRVTNSRKGSASSTISSSSLSSSTSGASSSTSSSSSSVVSDK